MKDNIRLYIDSQPVDLGDESLVQLNYTAEELRNPSIVCNSYSQSVTLPGTAANNRLFGAAFRLDRRIADGSYNPLHKVVFLLYAGDELVERGYVRLDTISREDAAKSYAVTLFGGLGAFFYALTYDENGNKRTLADLPYGYDLGFTINRTTLNAAWNGIESGKWGVVNFAPCYNGIPSSIAADKVLVDVSQSGHGTAIGVQAFYGGFPAHNGYVLATLPDKVSEWEVRDLRSYLQRPVVNVKAMVGAMCNPATNGGWSVVLDENFFSDNNPYWAKAWLTLPMLGANDAGGSITDTLEDFAAEVDIVNNDFVLLGVAPQQGTGSTLALTTEMSVVAETTGTTHIRHDGDAVTIAILEGYNAQNQRAAISAAVVLANADTAATQAAAEAVLDANYGAGQYAYSVSTGEFTGAEGEPLAWSGGAAAFAVNDVLDIQYWYLRIYGATGYEASDDGVAWDATRVSEIDTLTDGTLTFVAKAMRSGAVISQERLFAGTDAPAKYLLDYCKLFGLHFVTDRDTKTISILADTSFYLDSVTDIEARIDRRSAIDITPTAGQTRWLNFSQKVGGAAADEYAQVWNAVYGRRRVNTGYEFNADEQEVFEDSVLRGAVQVLENGYRYAEFFNSQQTTRPSWMIRGASFRYGDDNGTATDEWQPTSPLSYAYYNAQHPTYDVFSKPQFHDAEGKATDGAGVLLFYNGMVQMPEVHQQTSVRQLYYRLTDDIAEMPVQSGGNYTWLWTEDGSKVVNRDTLPAFSRWSGDEAIDASFDVALAAELYDPTIKSYTQGCAVYDRFWSAYIADRYNRDTQVVRCRVDLRGLKTGAGLFRRFWWFDNSLWLLNRLENYNPASWDAAEAEFIRVHSTDAYLLGQRIPGVIASRYTISLSVSKMSVANTGETIVLTIVSNDAWTLASAQPWAVPQVVSGGTQGVQTTTAVPVVIGANTSSGTGRSVTLVVRGAGGGEKSVTIAQESGLAVSPETIATFPATGVQDNSRILYIYTEHAWSIENTASAWLTLSATSGVGNAAVVMRCPLTADANTGALTISAGGLSVTRQVRQTASAYEYALELTPASWEFAASGGSKAVTAVGVTYQNGVEVARQTLAAGDLTITKQSGSGAVHRSGLSFTASDLLTNETSGTTDVWRAVWTAHNEASGTLTMTQEANIYTSRSAYVVEFGALVWNATGTSVASWQGDSAPVQVTGKVVTTYTYTSGHADTEQEAWSGYTLTPSSSAVTYGEGDVHIGVNNDTNAGRTLYLYAMFNGNALATLPLTQAARAWFLFGNNATSETKNAGSGSGTISFSFTTNGTPRIESTQFCEAEIVGSEIVVTYAANTGLQPRSLRVFVALAEDDGIEPAIEYEAIIVQNYNAELKGVYLNATIADGVDIYLTFALPDYGLSCVIGPVDFDAGVCAVSQQDILHGWGFTTTSDKPNFCTRYFNTGSTLVVSCSAPVASVTGYTPNEDDLTLTLFSEAITTTPAAVDFGSASGSASAQSLRVNARSSWVLIDVPEWVVVSAAYGTGTQTISVQAASAASVDRSATMRVQSVYDSSIGASVTFTQRVARQTYIVDDATSDGSIDAVTTSDGQTGLTGVITDELTWMNIDITNTDTDDHTFQVAGTQMQALVRGGDTATLIVLRATILALIVNDVATIRIIQVN